MELTPANRDKITGEQAVEELRKRRAMGHAPGCKCATRDKAGLQRIGCQELAEIACWAGLWREVQ